MTALLLCAIAFAGCFLAGRRSLTAGLIGVLITGYFYGIVRANVPSSLSHFIFDAVVAGLFLTQYRRILPPDAAPSRALAPWMALLIGWPLALLLLPIQDPMVQLVGLRAHVFLLPFLLIGAHLRRLELDTLVLGIAALNLVAFTFAVTQFLVGIEPFYPRNEVTELIYRSRDVQLEGFLAAYRIPAIFANSSAFGGTMVVTLPFLLGAWVQRREVRWQRYLLTLALAATVIAVFLSASRLHFMVLLILLLVSTVSGRLGAAGRLGWIGMLAILGWVISADSRLFQRILSLNLDSFVDRLAVSVNTTFVDLLFRYPMGNGLGGGGSSMPYFLQHLIREPVGIENQYGTILLEQGFPGLFIWVAFILWFLLRKPRDAGHPWHFGRTLAWYAGAAYFASGFIGIGLLTSVPSTVLLLMAVGWAAVAPAPEPLVAAATVEPDLETEAEPGPPLGRAPVAPSTQPRYG